MKRILATLWLLTALLPIQLSADIQYPFPIPPDFKNAPFKFTCEYSSPANGVEKYYNPTESWIVTLDLRNNKEISIMVNRRTAEKVYLKLFTLTKAGWVNVTDMNEDEQREWYANLRVNKKEIQSRRECFTKSTIFERNNNLESLY